IIPVDVVYQELDYLPEGFSVPEGRQKPWGTNHALMMGKDVIKEPFAVINADDFYGRESFAILAEWLSKQTEKNSYCMVGYRVGNTLSASGSVSRGICETNDKGELTSVVERTQIDYHNGGIAFKEGEEWTMIEANVPVSMNMWGFTPDYFKYSEDIFVKFLKENMSNLKSEFFIPLVVNELIQDKKATVRVLDTPSKWFGVTYPQDRPDVVAKIQTLVDKGEYPSKLF
ncbi:MAG: nucleotidyltransferase, partial [Bacteroidales bacterium]